MPRGVIEVVIQIMVRMMVIMLMMLLLMMIKLMMTMRIVQELLKKYGFGRWTKPEEVWKGRNISRLSVIITMIIIIMMMIMIIIMMMIPVNQSVQTSLHILDLCSGDSGVIRKRGFQLKGKCLIVLKCTILLRAVT